MQKACVSILTAAALVVLFSDPAFAYVGPGAGLSAFGTLFTLLSAVVLGIVGFIWYPIKRLLRRKGNGERRMPQRTETRQSKP
jgi:hypothetical protein